MERMMITLLPVVQQHVELIFCKTVCDYKHMGLAAIDEPRNAKALVTEALEGMESNELDDGHIASADFSGIAPFVR